VLNACERANGWAQRPILITILTQIREQLLRRAAHPVSTDGAQDHGRDESGVGTSVATGSDSADNLAGDAKYRLIFKNVSRTGSSMPVERGRFTELSRASRRRSCLS
jgi:hypothetical protein